MEIVQEQRLQLKMKLLLGYNNMKVVMLCRGGRYKNLVEGIFPGRGRLSKACADDGFLVK